jgi:hypothetical protein
VINPPRHHAMMTAYPSIRRIVAPAMWAWLLVAFMVRAGTIETFTAALNDWTNTPGSTVWRATNQFAEVAFAASLVPATSSLIVTGGISGSAFIGDYDAKGIEAIGFKFRAEQVLPSTLTIRLLSGTNGYFQNVQTRIAVTGVWYQFVFSLESRDAGSWDGDAPELFPIVRQQIDSIAISVTKPSTMVTSRFRIDDIFIDRMHTAGAVPSSSSAVPVITAEFLQTNLVYGIETAPSLGGPWTREQTINATNRTMTWLLTNTHPVAFGRIVQP